MFAKISRIFLYASLLTPLVVLRSSFFPFIAGKAISFRILVELALLCFLCHALMEFGGGELRSKKVLEYLKAKLKQPVVIAAAIFGIIYLVCAFTGVNPNQSFWSNFERGDGALQLIHYVLFFILAVLLFPDSKSMRRLVGWNIIASIPICLYALGQLIAPSTSTFFLSACGGGPCRASGTLGNPSYLAAYLIFNLAFIAYFFLTTKQSGLKIGLAGLFTFESYIFLTTGTRGALVGAVVGIVVLLAVNLLISKNKKIQTWLGLCLLVGIGAPALFLATHNADIWTKIPVVNRLIDFKSAASDIQPRLWTWNTAIQGVKNRPLLGYGAENFPYAFDAYYNPNHYGIESFFDRTHNIFLEYLITGGTLLLLAWLALFYFWYRRLMRQPKDLCWSILFTVPVMYLGQGFFLFDTLPIFIALFLFLAFSLSEGAAAPVPGLSETVRISLPQMITVLILTGATAGTLYYTAYLPARKNYLLTQALVLQGNFSYQVEHGIKDMTVGAGDVINAFRAGLNFNSPVGQEETIGSFQKFVIYVADSISKDPAVTKNPQFIAQIRDLVDETDRWYDDNLKLFPGIKQAYLNGGIDLRVGLAFNQPDLLARGKRIYADALTIAPKRLEVIRVLIEVARIEKDQAAFARLIARAKELRPDIVWK